MDSITSLQLSEQFFQKIVLQFLQFFFFLRFRSGGSSKNNAGGVEKERRKTASEARAETRESGVCCDPFTLTRGSPWSALTPHAGQLLYEYSLPSD